MTVNQLIKKLEKVREKHGKRAAVVIDWKTFQNDDYSHTNVKDIEVEVIPWAKDDSFERADGTERLGTVVTLKGE